MTTLALVESDNKIFHEVLDDAIETVSNAGVQYLMMGGISASAHGGSRFTTHDIDFFVKQQDAETALKALAKTGFTVEKTHPQWLYKGFKKNVMVDIIFKSSGEVVLSDEMMEHSTLADFNGR